MTCKRAAATIFFVLALPSAALAQAGTITKGMQNNCANDYKKFCGDYGLQTAALNLCMKKAGPSLSPAKEKLFLDVCNWLLGRDDLLTRDNQVWQYPRVALGTNEQALWLWGTRLGLPVLFVYLGLVVLLVRRRR